MEQAVELSSRLFWFLVQEMFGEVNCAREAQKEDDGAKVKVEPIPEHTRQGVDALAVDGENVGVTLLDDLVAWLEFIIDD
jgi:hypothetical protein